MNKKLLISLSSVVIAASFWACGEGEIVAYDKNSPAGIIGDMVKDNPSAALPFADRAFDLVIAFETVYFWPEIEKCFAGVRRTLKEGGCFVIVNEDDGLTDANKKWEKIIDGMHTYTPDELRTHLTAAGFLDIGIHRDEQHHWLCVLAKK